MAARNLGNACRTTVVCVDSRDEHGLFAGRLFNPYMKEGVSFCGVMEFLRRMEDLLDEMRFPQSFTITRSFAPAPSVPEAPCDSGVQEGKCATFAVRVMFRQNASWQGSVTWLEGKREESFRSALELLLLMDSALGGESGGQKAD